MLVLERKVGSKTMIFTSDGTIEIIIIEKHSETVTLGITAPKEIAIERDNAKKKG